MHAHTHSLKHSTIHLCTHTILISHFNKTSINFGLRWWRWSLYGFHGIKVTAGCKSEREEEMEKRGEWERGGRGEIWGRKKCGDSDETGQMMSKKRRRRGKGKRGAPSNILNTTCFFNYNCMCITEEPHSKITINFTLAQRRKQDVMTAKTPNSLNQHLSWKNCGLCFIKLNLFVNQNFKPIK